MATAFLNAVKIALHEIGGKSTVATIARKIGKRPPTGERWATFLRKHDNDFLVERVHDGDLIGDYFVTSINNSKKKKTSRSRLTSNPPQTTTGMRRKQSQQE